MELLRILMLCLAAAISLQAAPASPFQPGDRWCAVGDSITHTGFYHRYLYLFYATRFPGRQIELFNCGLSGDTAAGTVARTESDILRYKPTVATIMLGMNDVDHALYKEGLAAPDLQQRRDNAIASHAANMKRLAEKLQAAGTRLIFITPSIFDETAVMARANSPGVNAALGRCAENTRKLARELNAGIVDFHGPMGELNRRQQQADPRFTLIGEDRVHPGEPGHFAMAYWFLKAQGMPATVADIAVDAAGKSAMAFTCQEEALPFPVPAACAPALKLVPFMEELNQERLRIANLPAGTYKLAIDDEPIASFTAAELEKGVNLALQTSTPQYRQALAVAKLDEERHNLMKRLRVIDYVEWKMGRRLGDASEFDYAAAARKLIQDPQNAGWRTTQFEEYLKVKPMQTELQAQLQRLVAEIRKASQPGPHRFTIQRE